LSDKGRLVPSSTFVTLGENFVLTLGEERTIGINLTLFYFCNLGLPKHSTLPSSTLPSSTLPSSTFVTFGEEESKGERLVPTLPSSTFVTFGEEESKGERLVPSSTFVTFGEEESKGERLVPTLPSSTFVTLGYQSTLLYPLLLL
ncbi:Hypothetical protein BRZCDTV_101, partial [Brazilian cedratvirus IHUMI]